MFSIYQLTFRDIRTTLKVDASKIVISTVSVSEFQEYIPVQGRVMPVKVVYLDAVEGGHVEQKYVEAGTWVEKGDTILRLSNTSLILNMMQREAEYLNLQEEMENARVALQIMTANYSNQSADLEYQFKAKSRKYSQDSALFPRELISLDDYLKSRESYEYSVKQLERINNHYFKEKVLRENQIKVSEKFLNRMKKNLELINQKIDALNIVAPIKGQISSLNVEVGESKTAGQRLGQINIMDELKILADIDEHYIRRVSNGNKGEITLDKTSYTVVIYKILPDVENGRFLAELKFENTTPENVLLGQTLHINLQIGAESKNNALTLNKGGFYQSTAGQWAYVLSTDEKRAEKRKIKIGRQNTDLFEVLSGLQPGEKVITSGYDGFSDKEVLHLEYR
ncbi:MAG TPA: HlyD family efflux transporter periplasmic adaptor subunit [Chitinispirillaceae bacterium]|nr:HlyD family efflux transporter periplasmic adaptor subunit [Chitinispirillaceae bacterium]